MQAYVILPLFSSIYKKMIKYTSAITAIVMSLIFCHAKGQDTVLQQIKKYDAFCFYKLDDKYSKAAGTVEINTWVKEKTKQIQSGKITGDIFLRKGPGPNGSEWNPFTDLYIGIQLPNDNKNDELVINVNDKFFKKIKVNCEKIKWLVIKKSFWGGHLRKIKAKDIAGLYGIEKIDAVKKGTYIPSAPLDEGEILKINIFSGNIKLEKYFHVNYGE